MAYVHDALRLGVEEEFQIVDRRTGDLENGGYTRLMRHATDVFRHQMEPEFLQCVIECITSVCEDIAEVRRETMKLRATAAKMAEKEGLALVSAGTHPTGRWYDQKRTTGERYGQLEEQLQDVARTILIYGLHVHINVPDEEKRIQVINQARTYLPHILALSANSPFWMGRQTGYASYRTMVWAPFPFANVPEPFDDLSDYLAYRTLFERANSLSAVRLIWWDIRPHHKHSTIEFRIADMPMNHRETIALVAFMQALVQTLLWRVDRGQPLPVWPSPYIAENRWRAARFGLRGKFIDFDAQREVLATEAIAAALDLVSDAADHLGTASEIALLRSMLETGYQTGSERQVAVFKKRYDAHDVTRFLMEETMRGIDLSAAMPLAEDAAPTSDTGRRWSPFRKSRRPAEDQPQA
jgi:carboxylate-amine ligase